MNNGKITKKLISKYLLENEKYVELEKIWKEVKELKLNNKYLSTARIRKFWDHFSFVLSDSFFDGLNIKWKEYHSLTPVDLMGQ